MSEPASIQEVNKALREFWNNNQTNNSEKTLEHNTQREYNESDTKSNKENNQEVGNGTRKVDNSDLRRRFTSDGEGERFTQSNKNVRGNDRVSQEGGVEGRTSQNIVGFDSEGRRLNNKLLSKIEGTVVVDQDGHPLSLYHSSSEIFDTFNDGDVGFHFGTKEQAQTRAQHQEKDTGKKYNIYINAYLNIKKPVYSNRDTGSWRSAITALNLWSSDIISSEELKEIQNPEEEASKSLIKLLSYPSKKSYLGITITKNTL